MNASSPSRLFIAILLLALAILACNRSTPSATPAAALPTLPQQTPSARPTSSPTVTPTHTPAPFLLPATAAPASPTPVIPRACPPTGNPAPPERPAAFGDFAGTLAAYLSAGESTQGLISLLRDWGAITDDVGDVKSLDLTGDMNAEIVVALVDPTLESGSLWPPGDVLIFQCQGGAVVPVYRGRDGISQELNDLYYPYFDLHKIEDVNDTGRADVVYVTSTCGAHTCFDQLYVVEWDGANFVNRVPDMTEYPYPTFTVGDGQIQVHAGGIASAGAGLQRSYDEVWEWDGREFTRTSETVGPPTALIHYVHDGDDALAQGDYAGAIEHYQGALNETSLPSGLPLESEERGTAVVRAYARFKLVVAFAATGDAGDARSQYDLLQAEHPPDTPGHAYTLLGQAFWDAFAAGATPRSACAAAVTLAESTPTLSEQLYAGYANPTYEPADLCRVK
jgi:hypothetical protein